LNDHNLMCKWLTWQVGWPGSSLSAKSEPSQLVWTPEVVCCRQAPASPMAPAFLGNVSDISGFNLGKVL